MEGLSAAHGPRGIAVLTAGVAMMLIAGRQRADALWLLLVVFGGAALNHLLKHTILRPRPGMEHLNTLATDFSFPSGHAAHTTLLYGALALLLIRHVRTPGMRVLAGAFAGSAVLLVALKEPGMPAVPPLLDAVVLVFTKGRPARALLNESP